MSALLRATGGRRVGIVLLTGIGDVVHGLPIANVPLIVADLSFFEEFLGVEYAGLVCVSFLERYSWDLDFDRGTGRILERFEDAEISYDFAPAATTAVAATSEEE